MSAHFHDKDVELMLRHYGQQLLYARFMARSALAAGGYDVSEEEAALRAERRKELVEQISAEIVENLIPSDSQNPIVLEIMEDLEQEFKEKFELVYPPGEAGMHVYKESEVGFVPVPIRDRNQILRRLWEITQEKVDATMF
ncbi:DVU0524 family FlgM-associated protein [Desulfobaculum bizertense]|uniref:Uncharacterized protein n=1 Tax=Desulfobaculum bizertense DSM 18034 TaxID=1121442 RepID=A0A1T4W6N8_9BACT|nr:DVU0524 family FlgM-associated protein [Desulfobaculum bizertense]UIJ39041.1 hypothetical protein LWC08_05570 [Desulfobaculum bizertense]SKA72847.1 hypothetical protein SAMN02745702_01718 [Desulfobaculum bizertense DSM 18034]